MVTSEPVRDRMVALTRSISAATMPTNWSIEAAGWLSNGTITATPVSAFAYFTLCSAMTIETAGWCGKAIERLTSTAGRQNSSFKESLTLRELVRTNDIVLVSAIGALLDGAHIRHLVLDQNMSVIEGSLGVLPRRILVHHEDACEVRQILTEAGLAHELRPDD